MNACHEYEDRMRVVRETLGPDPDESDGELRQALLFPANDDQWRVDYIDLHLRWLKDQVSLLADGRSSRHARTTVLRWVVAPLVPIQELGRHPFSFQACCVLEGADPVEMQTQILRRYAPELLSKLQLD